MDKSSKKPKKKERRNKKKLKSLSLSSDYGVDQFSNQSQGPLPEKSLLPAILAAISICLLVFNGVTFVVNPLLAIFLYLSHHHFLKQTCCYGSG